MPTDTAIQGYIPIRPDLHQFLRWRENLPSDPTTALRLPGQGAICNYLTDLIQFGRTIYHPQLAPPREPLYLTGLTDRLRFECAPGFIDESFFEYADLVAHYFNIFLQNHWKEEVDRWSAACCYSNPQLDRKDAIADLHRISGMEYYREVEADIRANHRFRDYRNLVKHRRGK